MESSTKSSEELLKDPEWVKSFEERRKIVEKEEIEDFRKKHDERSKEYLHKSQTLKIREDAERKHRKELFDKMYNSEFTENFKKRLDGES